MILALLAALGFQDTAGLDRAVAAFTGRPIGDAGGARAAVDPRLRLKTCPTIALSWRTPAQDAVVVSCAGPDWRVFVPVRAAVPTPGAAVAPAPVAKPLPVIKRGDPVVIEAGDAGFSITREGVAVADATSGARVAVRVAGATQPVQAVAVAPGRVALPGFDGQKR